MMNQATKMKRKRISEGQRSDSMMNSIQRKKSDAEERITGAKSINQIRRAILTIPTETDTVEGREKEETDECLVQMNLVRALKSLCLMSGLTRPGRKIGFPIATSMCFPAESGWPLTREISKLREN